MPSVVGRVRSGVRENAADIGRRPMSGATRLLIRVKIPVSTTGARPGGRGFVSALRLGRRRSEALHSQGERVPRTREAFSLIELAIVTLVIGILVALVLPTVMRPGHVGSKRFGCVDNLKQVGLAARIFGNDNEDKFPWEVSTNQGGSREFVPVPFSAFRHFQAMSNEFSTPRILICPRDQQRSRATNFASFRDNGALSYFVGLDARDANTSSILSGDRFLGSTRVATHGLLTLSPLSPLWWTNNSHEYGGNIAMGDGSVQAVNSRGLLQVLRNTGLATNRFALPLVGP